MPAVFYRSFPRSLFLHKHIVRLVNTSFFIFLHKRNLISPYWGSSIQRSCVVNRNIHYQLALLKVPHYCTLRAQTTNCFSAGGPRPCSRLRTPLIVTVTYTLQKPGVFFITDSKFNGYCTNKCILGLFVVFKWRLLHFYTQISHDESIKVISFASDALQKISASKISHCLF